ncbi:unnamed protein product, partial [Mesorhabditis spiculigera]
MSSRTEADIDKEYLSSLEQKLKKLRDPKGKKSTSKALISDLAAQKEHQLFKLITTDVGSASSGFDDNFVEIQPNILQRKIAPHTCAINTQEKLRLVKHDIIQALHQELEEERKQAAEEQTDEQVTEAQAALQIVALKEDAKK